jgi:hypothetical protein
VKKFYVGIVRRPDCGVPLYNAVDEQNIEIDMEPSLDREAIQRRVDWLNELLHKASLAGPDYTSAGH